MEVFNTFTEEELTHIRKELEKISFSGLAKSATNKRDLIVEDVIYFDEKDGKFYSTAENTFYFQFLTKRSNATPQGQRNKKAVEDFVKYQQIFLYLMEKGYLNNSDYCLGFDKIEGGACFSLNLGKLLNDVDLEDELHKHFSDQLMGEYIRTFCNPVDSLRCVYCGSVSYSRVIKDNYMGHDEVCCLACHPLRDDVKGQIESEYDAKGTMAAVVKRLALIEEYSRVKIPEGKSINSLIQDYKNTYKTDIEDVAVSEIRSILTDLELNNYDVFSSSDYEVLLLDMESIQDIDNFSEVVGLDFDTGEILVFFNKEGVCMINERAIEFVKELARRENKK